jgi:hypothetical protein
MEQLGTRVGETLEERIAARLNEALRQTVAADFVDYGNEGLASKASMESEPVMRLSIGDVARVAAAEARAWF